MPLSKNQINGLLKYVVNAEPDPMDCAGCYSNVAEFSDAYMMGEEIPQALQAVETHHRQCPCCRDEFESLLDGLRNLAYI